MSAYERRQSDGQPRSSLLYHRSFNLGKSSPASRELGRGSMLPPPLPIDPALDPWNTSNIALSPGIGLDHLLPPTTGLLERSNYGGAPGAADNYPQDVQLPSMRQSEMDTNPLLRFYNDPGPWSSQRISGDASQPSIPHRYPGAYGRDNRSAISPQHYRDSPRSDVGSSTTGRNPQDSGYDSKSMATKSVRSTEHVDHSQGCQSLAGDVNEMQIYPEESYQGPVPGIPQDVSYFDISSDVPAETPATLPLICPYPECKNLELKNQSDQRKHELRHTRPFECQEPNCNRKTGFSTKNDLDRHKKSVHKIAPRNTTDKSYRCAAKNCPKKGKLWPRLDNFRQHCHRMHAKEDCEGLVRISELNSGYFLHSPNVDAFSQESELSPVEEAASNPTAFTNLHALQKGPAIDSTCHQESNALPQLIDRDRFQMNGEVVEIDCPKYSTLPRSLVTPTDHDQPSLIVTDVVVQNPNMKSTASSRNSPDRGNQRRVEQPQASNINFHIDPKINNNAPGIRIKADEVSQKIAADVANRMSTGTLEEIQLILKQSVLSLFNPDGTRKRTSEEASLGDPVDPKRKRMACEYCPKTMIRHCDLRKHKKRHTRPYGCTFTSCSKAFGSKNDWKRHENTQHYQIEAWRCHEESPASLIKQCAKVFHRREQFQAHLKDHHLIKDDEYVRAQTKLHRIGRNGQMKFWCGFCQKIVNLKASGLAAWDERFNHIDDYHFKQGRRIDEWYPLDKDIPKGQLSIDHIPDDAFASAVPEDNESEESSSDDSTQCTQKNSPTLPLTPPTPQASSRSDPSGKSLKKVKKWFCCACADGPHSMLINDRCTACNKPRCENCNSGDQQYCQPGSC